MRLLRAIAIVACGLPAACSLIVQFHDQPTGSCEGGACVDDASLPDSAPGVDAEAGGMDALVESGTKEAAPPESGPPASPCAGKANGYYCGDNGLDYDAGTSNLVHCVDGGVGNDTACSGTCLHVPDPFPDACDPCVGVPNGTYCGRDLAGFPASNADIEIQCSGGRTVQAVACKSGCGSNGTMSACL